jgi:ATP-dependent DNA helicase RecQ
LRLYGGELFVNYIKIQESKIAQFLNIAEKEVILMLIRLDELGLADYAGKKDKPQITFITPRMDAGALPLNKKRIRDRRAQAIEKAKKIIEYTKNNKVCRTAQIVEYFGEVSDIFCGICDNCIQNKKENKKANRRKNLVSKILKTLAAGEAFSLKELFDGINEDLDDFSVGLIREMEDEGLIVTGDKGKIRSK